MTLATILWFIIILIVSGAVVIGLVEKIHKATPMPEDFEDHREAKLFKGHNLSKTSVNEEGKLQ